MWVWRGVADQSHIAHIMSLLSAIVEYNMIFFLEHWTKW